MKTITIEIPEPGDDDPDTGLIGTGILGERVFLFQSYDDMLHLIIEARDGRSHLVNLKPEVWAEMTQAVPYDLRKERK